MGATHQYPDGLALFLGTMFVPTADRLGPGTGFTHRAGDRVTIREPRLGSLVNWVGFSEALPPWTLGIRGLMANLAARGLLQPAAGGVHDGVSAVPPRLGQGRCCRDLDCRGHQPRR